MADGVQYIAELGIGYEQAMQDLDKLETLVRGKSITIGQLLRADFKIDKLFEQFNQPVPRLFSEIAKEATLMEEKIGMSVAAARKQMQGMGHIGDDIIEYFKKSGQKTAVEWTDAFEQEFRGTDFRKLMSPYIKWTEDGSGISPDDLTNELSDKFPQLSKDIYNYTELWERLAEQVHDFRAQAKQLAETGANNYFEQLQMTAQGTGDVFDRLIEQQERLHRAGGFTEGVGKGLMSAEDIQQMAAELEQVANIQSKISVTTDDTGKAVKVNIAYTGELNEKWQETYRWISQVDDETGAITEGFKRVSSVATESADAAKKLSDEFNRIQLATEKMNLSSIQIFEQGGDMPSADRLRAINAQMGEIKQNADSITRSDIERAKMLQYQSQLISVAAKEEKARQQAAAASSKEQRQAAEAERKEIAQISAQYKTVYNLQKDIRKYSLDTSGYSAQLGIVKEQSDALFEKLRTNQQITDEERKQLETNQQLLSQIQAQVSAQKSEKPDILSSDKSGGLLAQSGKWFGAYQIWHEMKRGATETVDTMREVETVMMEIGRVMELNTEQSNRLRGSLFGVSSEMAQTFKDTADISKRFAQAGYQEAAENIEMTRTALLAMNTAELDAVNSTDSMVGILKQWNLEGKDLITVIDKLNYAADNNAITTQDLVDGLLRSSSAAKNAKFSFEETVGALVALKEATGRSGKEIGTALNSLVSFTQRDQSRNLFESLGVKVYADESREALTPLLGQWEQLSRLVKTGGEDAVKALSNMDGIAELLTEDMAEVVGMQKEYNKLFADGLTDMQKMDVFNQSGVFRKNYWIALLENFGKIQEVVEDMPNAVGHSMRENARYMETFDAKIKQLVTSLQELAVQAGEAGLLDVAKGAVTALTAVTNFTKGVGGLIPVMITLAGVLAMIKRESIATFGVNIASGWLKSIQSASDSLGILKLESEKAGGGIKGFGAAVKYAGAEANAAIGPAGWIILLITALSLVSAAVDEYNRKQSEIRQKSIEAGNAAREQVSALEELARKHEQLLELGVSSDDERYLSLQSQITEALGGRAQVLNGLTVGTGEYADALQGAIDKEYEYIAAALEAKRLAQGKELIEATKVTDKVPGAAVAGVQLYNASVAQKSAEDLVSEYFKLLDLQKEIFEGEDYKKGEANAVRYFETVNAQLAKNEEQAKAYHQTIIEGMALEYQRANGYITTASELEKLREYLYGATDATDSQQIAIDGLLKAMFPLASLTSDAANSAQEFSSELDKWASSIDASDKAVSDLKSSISGLESSMQSLADGKGLTLDATLDLLDKYPQLASAIRFVGDEWYFEADALEAARQAQYNKLIETQAAIVVEQISANLTKAQSDRLHELVVALTTATDATARQAAMTEFLGFVNANAAGDIETLNAALAKLGAISTAANQTFVSSGASYRGNADAIKKQTDAINENIKATQEKQKEEQEAFNKTKKGLQDDLKDFEKTHKAKIDLLKDEKKAAEDSNKAILDGIKEKQKAVAEGFKEEEKAVKSRYDAEITRLREIKQETSREDARVDYLKSREELEREKANEQKKTGREAVERIAEIDKALADLDENESRRLRDVDIDEQISDLEKRRDSEIESIQARAEAEDERYERRISNIENEIAADNADYENKIKIQEDLIKAEQERVENEIVGLDAAWEMQRQVFENQIAGYQAQLDAARNANDAMMGDLHTYSDGVRRTTEQAEQWFNELFDAVIDKSDQAALRMIANNEAQLRSLEGTADKLQEIRQELEWIKNTGAISDYRGVPTGATMLSGALPIRSSHTGSLVTADGAVNVGAGEIIVREDISRGLINLIEKTKSAQRIVVRPDIVENLMRSAKMMEEAPNIIKQLISNNNAINNTSNSKNVRIDMRGSQFGAGVGGQRIARDLDSAILELLS